MPSAPKKQDTDKETTEALVEWARQVSHVLDELNIRAEKAATDAIIGADHGALSNLDLDHHLLYLLVGGSRALAGNWSLGNNNLTNVGDLTGTEINISAGTGNYTSSGNISLASDGGRLILGLSGVTDSYIEWLNDEFIHFSGSGVYSYFSNNTNIQMAFRGSPNAGNFWWLKDADKDYFWYNDDILMALDEKVYHRTKLIGAYSQAPGYYDIFANTAVRIGDSVSGAPTNYINISSSGDLTPKGSADIVIEKAAGNGIKVDDADKTFPWRDLLGDQFAKNTGATKPTLTSYNGVINSWQFNNGDEAYLTYHIPHDYVAGTDIHLHVHWSQTSATATGGTIDFKYSAIYAKGWNQATGSTFTSTPITATFSSIDINDGASGLDQYQHFLTELVISAATATAALFDRDDLEPDGVIELTLEMVTNNLTNGVTVLDPFIHYADIHYQSSNIGTKERDVDFYR